MNRREDRPAGAAAGGSTRALVAGLLLADAAYAYQQTSVLPAIKLIGSSFSVATPWAAWMLSAYLMVATVATPALGRVADLHGRRRLLLGALTLFAAGSVGAAASPWFPLLVVFRGMQGVGGIVLPLSMAVLRDRLPAARVDRSIGALIGAFSAGSIFGFGLGGFLARVVSWRMTFATGAVVVALSIVLLARTLPPGGGSGHGSFDGKGAALLATASVTALVGLTTGPVQGWAAPLTLSFLALSAVATAWWAVEEFSVAEPLLDLRLLRNRAVRLANLATVALGWGRFSAFLLLPDLVEANPRHGGVGLAGGALTVGLLMLPDAFGQTVTAPLAPVLANRFGGRRVFSAGLLTLAAALTLLAVTTTSEIQMAVGSLLAGAGAGLSVQTTSVVATQGIDEDLTGVSASLNSTIRRFAGGVGSQVSTALLAALAVGAADPGRLAFAVAFGVAAGLCLVGAVVTGARVPAGQAAPTG